MELEKKILENGKIEVDNILRDAKRKAGEEARGILSEARLDNTTKYNKLKKESQSEIKMKSKLLYFEIKQAELLAKQKVIEEIFRNVSGRITALEGNDLLKYVVSQIKKELHSLGDSKETTMIMHTNRKEYSKYLKALSTKTVSNLLVNQVELTELDKVNKELGTSITLSNEFVEISGGFILVTNDFDLNFSTEELIQSLINKHEKEIIKELFE